MMRHLAALLIALAATPALAGGETASVEAQRDVVAGSGAAPSVLAVAWIHADCVGPGLPATHGPHATHTENVPGFTVDPARPVRFAVTFLSLAPPGPCPVAVSGPVLAQDFTGTWRLTAVCRETLNPGAVFVDWTATTIAGFPVAQGNAGFPCNDYLNDPFSLDVTVEIGSQDALGVEVPAVGGVRVSITQ